MPLQSAHGSTGPEVMVTGKERMIERRAIEIVTGP
jgi:hypothetical protein